MRIYGALQASMAIMRIFFVSIPAGTKIGDAVIGQGCDLCGEGNVSMLKKSLTAVIVGYVVQALALALLAAAAGVCIFCGLVGHAAFCGRRVRHGQRAAVRSAGRVGARMKRLPSPPTAGGGKRGHARSLSGGAGGLSGRTSGGLRGHNRPARGRWQSSRHRRCVEAGRPVGLHSDGADGLLVYYGGRRGAAGV